MKKLLAVLLSLLVVLSLTACNKEEETPVEPVVDYAAKSEGVMTYAEYAALPSDGSAEVVVEGYVQACTSYWNGSSLYLADPDGAYYVYNGAISEDDFNKVITVTDPYKGVANGTKVKVSGTKSEWSGEVEIVDATVEIVDDGLVWVAEPKEVSELVADNANQKIKLTGTIEAKGDEGKAFFYSWNGAGQEGTDADLYFDVKVGETVYTLVNEYYINYAGTDTYEAITGLNVGDTVEVEAFLYWYEGPQPQVISVTVK